MSPSHLVEGALADDGHHGQGAVHREEHVLDLDRVHHVVRSPGKVLGLKRRF